MSTGTEVYQPWLQRGHSLSFYYSVRLAPILIGGPGEKFTITKLSDDSFTVQSASRTEQFDLATLQNLLDELVWSGVSVRHSPSRL